MSKKILATLCALGMLATTVLDWPLWTTILCGALVIGLVFSLREAATPNP